MTILSEDIKLRASRVMADVPEGGAGPSAQVIGFGESNTVFDDVDSVSRTLGNVSIRQVHMHVDTPNTDRLLGAYAIVAKVPSDPNVSVTLATCAPFAKRSEISTAIADYLIRGVRWNGFLLENHVAGQANIQIFQRPGTRVPTVGRTLVLVTNEDAVNEALQYVRVIKVESELQTFTDSGGSDYQAMVVKCDLQSPLSRAWPGTAPNRFFERGTGKTTLRDTTEADAANYYGAAATTVAASIGALSVKVASPYSQLVPSSTTSVPALDQRPAARKTITLQDSPRRVEIGITPHTYRTKIGQENRGLSYVLQCTPPPEPGTLSIAWVGLGNRYFIEDDGAGGLTGAGAGTVNYTTGSVAITLPSLPDVGSALVSNWGTRQAFTDRKTQGGQIRLPEFAWELDATGDQMIKPGTLVLTYTSGGTVRTATANAAGVISGAGTGRVDHPSRTVQFTPTFMIDPGGTINAAYDLLNQAVEILPAPSVDAGGFGTVTLAQQPMAGTLSIQWLVAQEVSNTSGGTMNEKNSQGSSTVSTRHVLALATTSLPGP